MTVQSLPTPPAVAAPAAATAVTAVTAASVADSAVQRVADASVWLIFRLSGVRS